VALARPISTPATRIGLKAMALAKHKQLTQIAADKTLISFIHIPFYSSHGRVSRRATLIEMQACGFGLVKRNVTGTGERGPVLVNALILII
jgi:hypothetical protein